MKRRWPLRERLPYWQHDPGMNMANNEFDPETMPGALAARLREFRMLMAWPVYLVIAMSVSAGILGSLCLGLVGR
jgi:hypothetical protein